ncbi:MAG: hypothetical protein ACRDN6_04110 [Gaiellaceae bacterium]
MGFALSALALSIGTAVAWHAYDRPYPPSTATWLWTVAVCLLAAGAVGLALSVRFRSSFGGPVGPGRRNEDLEL